MDIGFDAHHGTSTIARVRERPNNFTLRDSREMQGPDFLEPMQPDNRQLLLGCRFSPIRKLLLQNISKKIPPPLPLTDTSRIVSVYG